MTNNKVILGDNLDIINNSIIKENIKIDLVIIDPPYNENKSFGKYKDKWTDESKDFEWSGKKHSGYLNFLHPRIEAGKNILKEDGCMMLFIGDEEQSRVKILMENVFGEDNYIGTVVWDSNSNTQQSKKINRVHEYILIFAKNHKKFKGLYTIPRTEKDDLQDYANSLSGLEYKDKILNYQKYLKTVVEDLKKKNDNRYKDILKYKYLMPETNIIFRDNSSSDPRNGCFKELIHPITKEKCKNPNKGYRFSEKYIDELNKIDKYYELPNGKFIKVLENKRATATMGIIFGANDNNVPQAIRIHKKELNKKVMKTTGFDFKTKDKKIGIPKNSGFNTVKPYELLSELVLNFQNKEALIIDFFAGSGTTAIATEDANKKDGGSRQWILIEKEKETINNVLLPRLDFFNINI